MPETAPPQQEPPSGPGHRRIARVFLIALLALYGLYASAIYSLLVLVF